MRFGKLLRLGQQSIPLPTPVPDPSVPPLDTTGWMFIASNQATVAVGSPYVITVKVGFNVHLVKLNGVILQNLQSSGSGTTQVLVSTTTITPNAAGTDVNTLTAQNISGVPYAAKSVSVTVTGSGVAPPTISGFQVTPNNAAVGDTVTFNAVVANATALSLNGATIASLPATLTVASAGQSFSLIATGAGGSVSATVSLIGTGSLADFNARRFGPGVLRSEDFESAASLGANYTSVNNYILDNPACQYGNDGVKLPTLDTSQKASGTQSLNIKTYPSPAPGVQWPASGGAWMMDFSADPCPVQLGANTKFYAQERTRWDSTMLDTVWQVNGGSPLDGIKIFDIVASDSTPGPRPQVYNNQTHYDTSSEIKVVIVSKQHHNIYSYKYDGDLNTSNLVEGFGTGGDIMQQNALGQSACTYFGIIAANGVSANAPVTGCINMVANEWCTFEIEVTLGDEGFWPDRNAGYPAWPCWLNSTVRIWFAREGAAPVKIVDWNPTVNGYEPLYRGPVGDNQKFGKIVCFPYMTDKSTTQSHAIGNAWYDEIIISTQPINFPGGYTLPGLPAPAPTIAGLSTNTAVALPDYTCTDPVGDPAGYCRVITDFSGMQLDSVRSQIVVGPGGGHVATNCDALNTFAMSSLVWREMHPPSPNSIMVPANWDATRGAWLSNIVGSAPTMSSYPRLTCRHSYNLNVVVGDELICLVGVDGNAVFPNANGWLVGPGAEYVLNTAGKIAHFNLNTNAWNFTNVTPPQGRPGAAYDPVSRKIIIAGSVGLYTYDPVSPSLAFWIDSLNSPGSAQITDENGAQISGEAIGYANSLVYSAVDDRFYIINRADGSTWKVTLDRVNFANSTIQRLATTGTGPVYECKFDYDSANKLIGGGPVNGVFYAFNPLTKVWATRGIPQMAGYYVAYDMCAYEPSNNCYVILTYGAAGDYNANTSIAGPTRKTWAYRWQ